MDYVKEAVKMLRESSGSSNFDIRQESLFALAFIPQDPTGEAGGWNDNTDWKGVLDNRNQNDMRALYTFYQQNRNKVARYVTKCDVLRCFER
jgi:hypothetical protein